MGADMQGQTLTPSNPLFGEPQSVNPYYTRTQNDISERFQGQSMNNANPFVGQPQSVNPYYTRTPDMQSMNNANPFVGQPQSVNPDYFYRKIEKTTPSKSSNPYAFLFKKPKYPKHKNRKYSYSKLKL